MIWMLPSNARVAATAETAREWARLRTKMRLDALHEKIRAWAGVQSFALSVDYGDRALHLEILIIDEKCQNTGIGTRVMKEVETFADKHQRQVMLYPAHKDEWGPIRKIQHARLVRFYQRFGFARNTRRAISKTALPGMMIRLPNPKAPKARSTT